MENGPSGRTWLGVFDPKLSRAWKAIDDVLDTKRSMKRFNKMLRCACLPDSSMLNEILDYLRTCHLKETANNLAKLHFSEDAFKWQNSNCTDSNSRGLDVWCTRGCIWALTNKWYCATSPTKPTILLLVKRASATQCKVVDIICYSWSSSRILRALVINDGGINPGAWVNMNYAWWQYIGQIPTHPLGPSLRSKHKGGSA